MKTERLRCPDCGIPVTMPVNEDTAPDERLCNACYEKRESNSIEFDSEIKHEAEINEQINS